MHVALQEYEGRYSVSDRDFLRQVNNPMKINAPSVPQIAANMGASNKWVEAVSNVLEKA